MTWRGAGLLLASIAVVAVGAAVPALLIVGIALLVATSPRSGWTPAGPPAGRRCDSSACDELLSVGVANRIALEVTAGRPAHRR